MRIYISRTEKEKKSLFSSRIIYIMETEPHGWVVRRRMTDFNWLSQRLRTEFPSSNLPLFQGNDAEDIESYMNYLLTENSVLHSRFLIFFLSCTNMKKFYDKKEKEYKKEEGFKWFDGKNSKFESTETPSQSERPKDLNSIESQQSEERSLHLFLEEAHPHVMANSKLYSQAKKLLDNVRRDLRSASDSLKQLAELYSKFSITYSDIEAAEKQEIGQFDPKLSSLYDNLKTSMFQLSNSLEQKANIFKKFFEKNVQDLTITSASLCKVESGHPGNSGQERHDWSIGLLFSSLQAKEERPTAERFS